jgi:hypothetical protein
MEALKKLPASDNGVRVVEFWAKHREDEHWSYYRVVVSDDGFGETSISFIKSSQLAEKLNEFQGKVENQEVASDFS